MNGNVFEGRDAACGCNRNPFDYFQERRRGFAFGKHRFVSRYRIARDTGGSRHMEFKEIAWKCR